jgi:tetratricopeptide (TPR) repeat protein
MIIWSEPGRANVAAPAAATALLAAAVAREPDRVALRVRLANVQLDQCDFAGAASTLEAALERNPAAFAARPFLALCYNVLGRHQDALDRLADEAGPQHERALALLALGRSDRAEAELRALLEREPHHRRACRELGKLLRRTDRGDALLQMCEALSARGVGHAQLLYTWGVGLALAGQEERARALLFDASRVIEIELPAPRGFADIASFNAALADEILGNPYRLSEFPDEQANRGSSRVHALFAGHRPELIHLLLDTIQQCVGSHEVKARASFDPWARAQPCAARLEAWALIQRGGEFEEWHLHRAGWLSGVYYVQVPKSVSALGGGAGCIEFGAPTALQRAMPGYVPVWRHCPREGTLLLAPSHYPHRTIPSGADEYRISFAFDVVPEDKSGGPQS